MTMYASAEDVQTSWRPLSSAEMSTAHAFIDWASIKLRRRVPSLDARIAANEPDVESLARHITVAVVKRAMLNPEGWREETLDDFRLVRDAAVASGALYVSDDDVADLQPRAVSHGMYSVQLGQPW